MNQTSNATLESVESDRQGMALYGARRFAEAANLFRRAAALDNDVAAYQEHLGMALVDQGLPKEAAVAFQKALLLDPNNFMSLLSMATIMQNAKNWDQAGQYFQRVSEAHPRSYEVLIRWAISLFRSGDAVGAETKARLALELEPENQRAIEVLGEALQLQGKFSEAILVYEHSLATNPRQVATSFQGLTASKKFTEEDKPLVDQMETLATERFPTLREEMLLHVGLGKALDDLGSYGEAMEHFNYARKVGHRMIGSRPFNRRAATNTVEVYKKHFSKEVIRRYSHGVKSELPVLIVGMPRSGTTLLEQILTTHPEVGSGGELSFWRESPISRDAGSIFNADFANDQAVKYRMHLRTFAPKKKRIIDKMPINYTLLGPITMLFPNARIIHCRRHPVATCLSIMMNTLVMPEPPDYMYDLEDLVFYYREYLRLMEHWRSAIPADRLMEVDYEDIVVNKEATTRKVIEFCGLEWADACLHHEQNDRAVSTPSKWQVRQPIYSSSIEKWRRYEPWLGPLKSLLTPEELASLASH